MDYSDINLSKNDINIRPSHRAKSTNYADGSFTSKGTKGYNKDVV